jgi:hypothetical protein
MQEMLYMRGIAKKLYAEKGAIGVSFMVVDGVVYHSLPGVKVGNRYTWYKTNSGPEFIGSLVAKGAIKQVDCDWKFKQPVRHF